MAREYDYPVAGTVYDDVCRLIWVNTYKNDTLLPWSEVRPGTMHHKRVCNAARLAITRVEDAHVWRP